MEEQVNLLPDTPAFREEREKLPDRLRDDFDTLVKAYRYHAWVHYTRPFVSYKILADLIREGWRLSAESVSKE